MAACPQHAVLVVNRPCLSSIRCACLQYVVRALDTLCPSSILCACAKDPVLAALPVLDRLRLSKIRYACPRYAVPVLNTLSGPFAVPVPIRNRILTLMPLYRTVACVESVSVRFRSKERGTRIKDRAKSGASKKGGRGGEELTTNYNSKIDHKKPGYIQELSAIK